VAGRHEEEKCSGLPLGGALASNRRDVYPQQENVLRSSGSVNTDNEPEKAVSKRDKDTQPRANIDIGDAMESPSGRQLVWGGGRI